jgi:CRP/FNR family cyclic AMP-dependent transcriptional regulator
MRVCDDLAGAKPDWFTGKTMAAVSSHPLAATQMPSAAILDWPDSGECGSIAGKREPEELPVAGVDPLYLFCCGVSWHRQADAGAGWELIQGLRAPGREARLVASALLARAADMHLPVRDLSQTSHGIEKTAAADSQKVDWHVIDKVVTMNTPYGLEIIESCVACKLRRDKWFCSLSPEVLKSFSAASHLSTYPGGAVLFVEGQMPRGAFVLCSGKVKLSTTSREGKVLILKMATPGEALGLSAVISGTCYELTAETAGPCQVNFIERDALTKLLDKHGELGLHSAQALSNEFQSAYRDIHDLVLARSSAGKLAKLLLSWTTGRDKENGACEIRIRSSLTHEEMAQMIGSSRETVTRLLSELKKKELIRLEGSTLVIRNRTALEALAA